MEATKKSYPTDLTDDQWELIKELIPAAGTGGRKRSVDIRAILNAIFYINAAGCAWRMLPHDHAAQYPASQPRPASAY